MTEPPERFRTINGAWLLGSLAAGALVGLALHLSDQRFFPWWEVVSAPFAGIFALGAYFRRSRWEEKSATAMLAALFLFLPAVAQSFLFRLCMVILIFGYLLLITAVQMQRKSRGE